MKRILSLICLVVCILACQQINAACGPPMCNDNVLFAPAMVKLMYNHMHGNTTLPSKVKTTGPPCTACLPCCAFLASVEQSTIDQRDEIQTLNTIVDSVDWTCKTSECAQHHVELRNMVSKVIEEKSQPLLQAMSLKSTTNTDAVTQSIREHLEMYSRQIKRSRDFEKTKNENQFLTNLLSCPCTACPTQCAVRKLLFKQH
ncbi:predicted protein [Naegleria gruberi]|uniref:Predicted protein n=1 Tax=Naegleria gruberi TaxID=5762 RepID=D2VAC4_NAEGR|nr:uncharacterized protein NAEGRDRAFT_79200 [Naegleria gruberi]EFC46406.1 predicted protein [Naegleria gruberi]|eukprot:XP_002679150.1 predicted protein [Naegleria gruberi strain NEG-M]